MPGGLARATRIISPCSSEDGAAGSRRERERETASDKRRHAPSRRREEGKTRGPPRAQRRRQLGHQEPVAQQEDRSPTSRHPKHGRAAAQPDADASISRGAHRGRQGVRRSLGTRTAARRATAALAVAALRLSRSSAKRERLTRSARTWPPGSARSRTDALEATLLRGLDACVEMKRAHHSGGQSYKLLTAGLASAASRNKALPPRAAHAEQHRRSSRRTAGELAQHSGARCGGPARRERRNRVAELEKSELPAGRTGLGQRASANSRASNRRPSSARRRDGRCSGEKRSRAASCRKARRCRSRDRLTRAQENLGARSELRVRGREEPDRSATGSACAPYARRRPRGRRVRAAPRDPPAPAARAIHRDSFAGREAPGRLIMLYYESRGNFTAPFLTPRLTTGGRHGCGRRAARRERLARLEVVDTTTSPPPAALQTLGCAGAGQERIARLGSRCETSA